MRTGRYLWGILALLLCGLLMAGGCGGGNNAAQKASGVALSLTTEQTAAGPTVTLSAANAADMHQLSCRIAYNPQALRFVSAERGELVDSRAVFFSTAKGEAYVPVAFTYHAGETIPGGSGEIATLQFEVLDPNAESGLTLVTDDELLIARDALRRSIPVKTSGVPR